MRMPSPRRILIVEDEPMMLSLMEIALLEAGFSVFTAQDGEEALRVLEGESFDLIVLDLLLPRVDGHGVLRALAKKQRTGSVLILTNQSDQKEERRCRDMGVRDYLLKADIPGEALAEVISSYLEKEGPR